VRVLVTGGAGFIGHHIVAKLLADGHEVVTLDRLDCSGNLNRLAEIPNQGLEIVFHDLRAPISNGIFWRLGRLDWVLHVAAASHVDRSIEDPLSFVYDNVVGTCNALMCAREKGAKFLYFSTDEVFGPAPDGVKYQEWDRYRSGNPYAATKAGGEELAISFANTYSMHVVVTHTMNVFGRRQHGEKFIPSTIAKVADGKTVTIHSDKTKTRAGSRFYIHADAVADAVDFVMRNGVSGEKYNIVGEREVDNLSLAQMIAGYVGQPLRYEMVDFHSSRPGHDLRYALDGSKLATMGWTPPQTFDEALASTVQWTLAHEAWLN
jgi:dTDP-glucose 4,6-dehydratase